MHRGFSFVVARESTKAPNHGKLLNSFLGTPAPKHKQKAAQAGHLKQAAFVRSKSSSDDSHADAFGIQFKLNESALGLDIVFRTTSALVFGLWAENC